jgi:predicted ATPase
LALELAAARLKVMDLGAVAAQLEDRFRLLRGGDCTAPPRLQTMRASIDWSYQLLPGLEKSLLRRLSVFAGGCDLEAAYAVCADPALPEAGIVDLLEGLVNKSLVELVRRKGQAVRYRVLETIRQYAFGKLSDLGEATTVRTRHLDCFASLSGRAEQALMGPDQVLWFERLEAELDNVRGALEWSLQSGGDGAAAGLSLASNRWRFWFSRARPAEGAQWLKRTLKSSETFADPAVRALALARGAWPVFDDPTWADEALILGRGLGAAGRRAWPWPA